VGRRARVGAGRARRRVEGSFPERAETSRVYLMCGERHEMTVQSGTPWWRDWYGVPRWMDRGPRRRWPGWDEMSSDERYDLCIKARNERFINHSKLIAGLIWLLIGLTVVEAFVSYELIANGNPIFGIYCIGIAVAGSTEVFMIRRIRRKLRSQI
jgi:hypothetical protein